MHHETSQLTLRGLCYNRHMSMRDPRTEALRTEIYRRMSGGEKIALAMQMREEALAMVRDSIRRRRPDLSEDDLEFEVRERCSHLNDEYLERWIAALGVSDHPHLDSDNQ